MKITVDKEDFVVSVEREPSDLHICKGPWHYSGSKGTPLPASDFAINVKTGLHYKTCDMCRLQHQVSYARKNGKDIPSTPATRELPPPTLVIETMRPINPKWRITIVRETVVEVYAADFLDAAAQAGEGEVVKVERVP